jgi:hypothetical protein
VLVFSNLIDRLHARRFAVLDSILDVTLKREVLYYPVDKRFILYILLVRRNGKVMFLFHWLDVTKFLGVSIAMLDPFERRIVWQDISEKVENLKPPKRWKRKDMLIDKDILYEVLSYVVMRDHERKMPFFGYWLYFFVIPKFLREDKSMDNSVID